VGPKGDRLRGFGLRGSWRTLAFLGALSCDRLTAPCIFNGPINSECFCACVGQPLIPILKPGDIAIIGNIRSHKPTTLRLMLLQLLPKRRSASVKMIVAMTFPSGSV